MSLLPAGIAAAPLGLVVVGGIAAAPLGRIVVVVVVVVVAAVGGVEAETLYTISISCYIVSSIIIIKIVSIIIIVSEPSLQRRPWRRRRGRGRQPALAPLVLSYQPTH